MDIRNKIGKELLFFDGAMGSMLEKLGLLQNGAPELLNITQEKAITEIHKQYILAGSNIITTNTLGAYAHKFDHYDDIIFHAIKNVKNAIKETNSPAVSIAYDMGPTGQLLKPFGDLPFEDSYEIFKKSAISAQKHGADLFIVETMSDTYEAKSALLAIKENTALPVICTMTFDEKGMTLTGGNIMTMIAQLEALGADAIGINCGLGPLQIESFLDTLALYSSTPFLIQPNAGLPHVDDLGRTYYDIDCNEFASAMKRIVKKGAWLIGGCCGTTPEHIRTMVDLCKELNPPEVTKKTFTIVSSYSDYCILDQGPAIVGERINPTGKKKFKEALLQHDMSYLVNEALAQKDAGANILDVNVGLPEIDEKATMVDAVEAIQAVCNTPLQIDSSTPEVIEAALRIYNGKPLVNSISGKKEALHRLLPVVNKYGGVFIGLCIDEDGVPDTCEKRVEIAGKIIDEAENYGIERKNIVIDPLTLTVSAQQEESAQTLKALKIVKEKYQVKTLSGVSNISHGLPNRPIINTAYLILSLNAGADLCIINPSSQLMLGAYKAYLVLSGYDHGCNDYIKTYAGKDHKAPEIVNKKEPLNDDRSDLQLNVIHGLRDLAYTETTKMLTYLEPLQIINGHLMKALDYVGEQYESGDMFLPQLIMSAESAKASFDALKEFMDKTGTKEESKGRIILATVEGDSHDIGKNIIKALLENYSYEIIDLGKDVSPQRIVDTAIKENVTLVGLSALMTTTVNSMEKTIQLLKEHKPDCKVMVGGAVLNESYASMIGANYYGKDALRAIAIAKEHFSNE